MLQHVNTFVHFFVVPAAKLLKLLVDIQLIGIGGKTLLAEDNAQRRHLGNATDGLEVYFLIETSHQRPLVNDVQALTAHHLLPKWMAKLHALIYHTAKKQVEFRAVGLHAV